MPDEDPNNKTQMPLVLSENQRLVVQEIARNIIAETAKRYDKQYEQKIAMQALQCENARLVREAEAMKMLKRHKLGIAVALISAVAAVVVALIRAWTK
jgi:hypothetical protein